MSNEERLDRIERALVAIGELVALEASHGHLRDERREQMLRALAALGTRATPPAPSVPTTPTTSTAPGVDMSPRRQGGGAETDEIPPNLPTTYLGKVEETSPR